MTIVSNPKVNVTKTPASQTISNSPQKVLIVGQQTGSFYTSGQLIESISNGNSEITNLGKGSLVVEMINAYKAINEVTRVDVIPLDDDGGATKAAGIVAFSGTATAAGTITINVGSRENHPFEISIAIGDTATTVGAALVTALTADAFPIVTGINTTGSVAITATNGGTAGNFIGLESKGTVAGITVAVTAMSSGATDPSLTGLFDVVNGERYQTIIYPGVFAIATLTTDFLDPRFNVDNTILDGVGIISRTDSLANNKTFLNSQNSQSLVVHANKAISETLYKGSSLFELDDVISAEIGAIRALRLTDGANISSLVIASNLDTRGGTAIASLPYFNTPFFNLPILDIGKGWLDTEITELNDAGGFVIGNNITRTEVLFGQVYTTYKTDVAGNPDITYQFLNSVDVFSNIAEFFFNNLRADYAQFRLTDGNVEPGRNIANEKTIRSSFIEYYQTMSGADYLLTRSGQDNVKFFSDNLTFTLDLEDGKVTSIAQVPLVVQLRQLDVILQATFSTT